MNKTEYEKRLEVTANRCHMKDFHLRRRHPYSILTTWHVVPPKTPPDSTIPTIDCESRVTMSMTRYPRQGVSASEKPKLRAIFKSNRFSYSRSPLVKMLAVDRCLCMILFFSSLTIRQQQAINYQTKAEIGPHTETSMKKPSTFLVFGGTGGTGKHFVSQALAEGHKVRALVRNPAKMQIKNPNLEILHGSITEVTNIDELVQGSDYVVSMLGDANLQRQSKINTAFVKQLVPAMRRQGVKRFLYQAGGLSVPYKERLSPYLWILRKLSTTYAGQHADNESVMEYLCEDAKDVEWIVHRAGIGSDGPSQGVLKRSVSQYSIATFRDCAAYNLRVIIEDEDAIHTMHHSYYA